MPTVRQVVSRPQQRLQHQRTLVQSPSSLLYHSGESSVSSSLDWVDYCSPLRGKEGYKSASSNLSRVNLCSGLQPQQEPGKGQECESEAQGKHVTVLRSDWEGGWYQFPEPL